MAMITPLLAALLFFQADDVIRVNARLVLHHATVADGNGRLLTTLAKTDFTVAENNVRQAITYFKREDVPVSMGLVVDTSGSMRGRMDKVAAAAFAFVKASNPGDEVFIVNFNDELKLDAPFTNDRALLGQALAKLTPQGGTAMRDAIKYSLDYLKTKGKHEKKVLLVITDGDDNMSSEANTLDRVIAEAQRREVLVYSVGFFSDEERGKARNARQALTRIAQATGGAAFFPEQLGEIEPLCLQIAHEIRNQYVLGYSPSEQTLDGSFRRVRVTAKGPGHPTVRTRSGYYATK
jgi:VWFA-related protein